MSKHYETDFPRYVWISLLYFAMFDAVTSFISFMVAVVVHSSYLGNVTAVWAGGGIVAGLISGFWAIDGDQPAPIRRSRTPRAPRLKLPRQPKDMDNDQFARWIEFLEKDALEDH